MYLKSKNKIPAFTILEIVISLAIMSIIVAMTYGIYVFLSQQLYDYSSQTDGVNNYLELDVVLKRDLFKATQILEDNETLYLFRNKDTIQYYKNEDYLVRATNKNRDTFLAKIIDFKILKEDVLLAKKIQRIHVKYDVLGVPITGLYFKNLGVASQINKHFFTE